VILAGGLLTASYMFRVLAIAMRRPRRAQKTRVVPARLEWTALALAVAALLLGLRTTEPLELLSIGWEG
jgi:multicomponent Na+:H+ antiporter subunit D